MGLLLFYLGFIAAILLLEIVAGRHRGLYTRVDWTVNLLCGGLGLALVRPLTAVGLAALLGLSFPAARGAGADTPVWLAVLTTLILSEFVFYWVHRWSHEGRNRRGFGWLWKLHRTHHSGKYMNALVVLRINLGWAVIQPQGPVLAACLFLGQPLAATLVGIILYAWNLITHSHFRWDDAVRRHPRLGRLFRMLEHVIVSPGVHHSHHGYGKDGTSYRNFGVIFSGFDTIFGTLHIPEGRPWRYGLPGRNAHWSEEVFYPLIHRRPAQDTRAADGLGIPSETIHLA